MTFRAQHLPARLRAALLLTGAAVLAALVMPISTATALKIQPDPAISLDGETVLSPAAELIRTTERTSGAPIGPGVTVDRQLILLNRNNRKITYDFTVSEVVGSNAESIVEVRHGSQGGAAAWVTLEVPSVTLAPGSTAFVNLKIAIPDQVKPGSKSFAVSATQRPNSAPDTGAGIAPTYRQSAVYTVDLPGKAPIKGTFTKLDISAASDILNAVRAETSLRARLARWARGHSIFTGDPTLTLSLVYANEGERILRPGGRVQVKDIFGRVAGSYSVPNFTVYPAGEAGASVDLKKLPSVGWFTARVTLTSDAGTQERVVGRFLVLPTWLLWVLAALLVYGLYHLVRYAVTRIRNRGAEIDDYDSDSESDGDEFDEDDPLP